MAELTLDLRFILNESDLQTIKERLADIEKLKGKASPGGDPKATKARTNVEKELNDEFRRRITLDETRFRRGELNEQQALQAINQTEQWAQEQGVLNNETLRGVRAQRTLFLAQQRVGTGFTGLAGETRRANNALSQLGRVTQDLPFGFLGISNNIDPLLQEFRRLRKESGGTKGALMALLGSLTGSGGLIFALGSLLPTAILVSQTGFNFFSKNARGATDEVESLEGAVGDFIKESARLRQLGAFSFLDKQSVKSEIEAMRRVQGLFDRVSQAQDKATASSIASQVPIKDRVGLIQDLASNEGVHEERLQSLQEKYGLNEKAVEKFNEQLDGNIERLKVLNAITQEDPFAKFREDLEQNTEQIIDRYNAIGANILPRIAEIRRAITGLQQQDADVIKSLGLDGISQDEAIQAILLLKEQLEDLENTLPERPAIEIRAPEEEVMLDLAGIERALFDITQPRRIPIVPELEEFDIQADDQELQDALSAGVDSRAQEQLATQSVVFETMLANANAFEKRRLALTKERIDTEIALIEAGKDADRAAELAKTKFQAQQAEQRRELAMQAFNQSVNLASGFVSALTQLNQAQSDETEKQARKRFETQKKLSLSQAIIDGISSAVGSFKVGARIGGPPLGAAFAAASTAATAVMIEAIRRQTFNSTGSISGGGFDVSQSTRREQDLNTVDEGPSVAPVRQEGREVTVNVVNTFDNRTVAKVVRDSQNKIQSNTFTV